jgi:hypothetical protein
VREAASATLKVSAVQASKMALAPSAEAFNPIAKLLFLDRARLLLAVPDVSSDPSGDRLLILSPETPDGGPWQVWARAATHSDAGIRAQFSPVAAFHV